LHLTSHISDAQNESTVIAAADAARAEVSKPWAPEKEIPKVMGPDSAAL